MPTDPTIDSSGEPAPAKRIDWAGLFWLYLFFWYFSGITQALTIPATGFIGFRSAFYMSFLWLAPVLLFPRATKQIGAIAGVVLWLTSTITLAYWIIYRTEISQSVIFAVLETNAQEAREFIGQYITFSVLAGIAAYSVFAWLIWRRLRPVHLPRSYAAGAALAALALSLGMPYVDFLRNKKSFAVATNNLYARMEPAAPWQLLGGYLQYRKQLDNVQSFLDRNSSLPPLEKLADANGDAPRTLVLVIGESTTSQHMSLYGYPRKTTPLLEALKGKGELFAFSDVITARPWTIGSLQQALSFANQQEPRRYLTEPNLLNLMKQAGYKIFWVTNQQAMSEYNTLLTAFSQQADVVKYLNNNRVQKTFSPDQVVFEPFAEILADPAPKKFIVLHLLGAHTKYSLRYPSEYDRFTGRDHVPEGLTDKQAEIWNSYDNAILYNDFVVTSLIDIFSRTRSNGFLVYFSDHGEEVFSDLKHEVLGRNENKPTRNMYAIPFLVWLSPEWKETHPAAGDFASMLNRRYSNAYFIHTWSDLAGLSYDRYRPEFSLVNPGFKPHVRWIGEPEAKGDLRDFDAVVTDYRTGN